MVKTFKIKDKKIAYSVNRRDIKHPRLEFKTGRLVLILSKDSKNETEILKKHKRWIYSKNKAIEKALKEGKRKKINRDMDKENLKSFVHNKISHFSNNLKVELNKIFIRKMVSKWASMSDRRNLTINSYVKYLPAKLIEYIIFHELSHLHAKKHDSYFWNIVKSKYKNHNQYEADLFQYWFLLQKIMGGDKNDYKKKLR